MTLEEAIKKARTDYARVAGTIIEVDVIHGCDGYDNCEWYCDPPLRVLVLPTNDCEIARWGEEWVDPYWEVRIVEDLLKPEFRRTHDIPATAGSFWVDGPSCPYEKIQPTSGVVTP